MQSHGHMEYLGICCRRGQQEWRKGAWKTSVPRVLIATAADRRLTLSVKISSDLRHILCQEKDGQGYIYIGTRTGLRVFFAITWRQKTITLSQLETLEREHPTGMPTKKRSSPRRLPLRGTLSFKLRTIYSPRHTTRRKCHRAINIRVYFILMYLQLHVTKQQPIQKHFPL